MRKTLLQKSLFVSISLGVTLLGIMPIGTLTLPPAQAQRGSAIRKRADSLITRGAQLYLKKRYVEALKLCLEATKIEPRYARGYVGLGATYAALKQREAAGRAFRLALTLGATGKDAQRARDGLKKLGLSPKGEIARVTRTTFGPQRGTLREPGFKARGLFTVSPDGDIKTIGEAIQKASPYTRIEIQPGTYTESLVITKPLQLVGVGEGDVVIESTDQPAVLSRSLLLELRHLTIRGKTANPGLNRFHAVEVAGGRTTIQDCMVTSESRVAVSVHGVAATAVLRNSKIQAARTSGLLVYDEARVDFYDGEISGAGYAGIEAMEWGDVVVKDSTLTGNRSGVVAQKNGRILLQDTQVVSNVWEGLNVQEGGLLTLKGVALDKNPREITTEKGGTVKRLP